eukprot:TRINITY_DN10624_c0_g1_i1.p1 TRINITY_DN10624_c0_g1~~TRINITY_DN10624_c0_g1_i1.p1  ORF type:complete len:129 (-),score=28.24 TRINITY_DN10624_c0_g1_i1:39-425(-)
MQKIADYYFSLAKYASERKNLITDYSQQKNWFTVLEHYGETMGKHFGSWSTAKKEISESFRRGLLVKEAYKIATTLFLFGYIPHVVFKSYYTSQGGLARYQNRYAELEHELQHEKHALADLKGEGHHH